MHVNRRKETDFVFQKKATSQAAMLMIARIARATVYDQSSVNFQGQYDEDCCLIAPFRLISTGTYHRIGSCDTAVNNGAGISQRSVSASVGLLFIV